jgi:hypothetical protein
MKKLFLLFLMIITGCTGMGKLPQQQMVSITGVIDVPGMAKEQIFNKTVEWAAKYMEPLKVDANSGIILAAGEICHPSRDKDRPLYTIVFTMQSFIRDNNAEVTFADIKLKAPGHFISEAYTVQEYKDRRRIPVVSERDIESTGNALQHVVDNLADGLKGTTGPLTGYPACGA